MRVLPRRAQAVDAQIVATHQPGPFRARGRRVGVLGERLPVHLSDLELLLQHGVIDHAARGGASQLGVHFGRRDAAT